MDREQANEMAQSFGCWNAARELGDDGDKFAKNMSNVCQETGIRHPDEAWDKAKEVLGQDHAIRLCEIATESYLYTRINNSRRVKLMCQLRLLLTS